METRSDKEDERIRDTITEEGSTDPSNSYTVTFEDHDVSEYEMEDEEVLEIFRRNSGVRPEVSSSNSFTYLNKSEEVALQFEEDTPAETEQTNAVFQSSEQDTNDSSSSSDLDFSLSRYYFDGSLPETHEDESPVPKDENQVSLLCPKQLTSWRNFCGLFGLLRAADP
ncbi:hypothetical protein Bca52824_003420 [Brassica carinata]|uniref:Uncharacterized protein n=1 Tax=Brassica carinata TaxID=52824 RepID=A0A8X7WN04_BRACI|nr:hypothetical protein Bca52824_003420 [Brassica carinata]